MKLVVGLGNPGREYVSTRHNVGFEALDVLAQRLGWIASADAADGFARQARGNFEGLTMDGPAALPSGRTEKLLLLKPMTYMNLSGRSVQAAMAFHKLDVGDLLVVLDDMALPAGKLRLRAGGSHAGHNGLRDVERALGTSQYPRLRIGIDPPPPRVPWADYVLQRFTPEQRERVNPALKRAADAVLTWIDKGITAAMNAFNADDPTKDEGKNRLTTDN